MKTLMVLIVSTLLLLTGCAEVCGEMWDVNHGGECHDICRDDLGDYLEDSQCRNDGECWCCDDGSVYGCYYSGHVLEY